MTNRIEVLMLMADKVVTEQNCVMEVIMNDNTIVARLVPLELYQSEKDDEWEDDDE